jgi:hypothetical protein
MNSPRKPPKPDPRPLIVFRCPACREFVAASRDPNLIKLARRYHDCPASHVPAA